MRIPVAAIVLLVLTASGASAQPLTLRDAVDEALTRNPAAAAADARMQSAAARLAEARAARLPRLDLTESATRGNNPVFVFGSLLEQGRFGQEHFDPAFLNAPDAMTNYRAAITARYALFDRFSASSAIAQGHNAVAGANVETEETRQRIRADVVARYYAVALAIEKLAAAGEAVRAAEADAKSTRDRFEQGLLVEADALSSEVHLATLRQRAIAAEGDLAVARASLATTLRRPFGEVIAISGPLDPASWSEPDLDAAVARAITTRAPVQSAALATSDARLRLRSESAARLPRVDAFGTFGASGATFGNRNSDHTAGLAVTLELFDRGRTARIAAARANLAASDAGEAAARDAIAMEVVAAWHRHRAARQSAAVAEAAVEQAQAAARIVRDRYEQGLTTITEHLRAQSAAVSARFELLAARHEAIVAHAELLRATGDLADVQPFM